MTHEPHEGVDDREPVLTPWATAFGLGLVAVHVATAVELARVGPLWDALLFERTPSERRWVGGHHGGAILDGEWWRMGTGVLLHVHAVHLMLNVLAVMSLGAALETRRGARHLGATLVGGGLAGALTTHLLGAQRSDGASGAAFGLAGALLMCPTEPGTWTGGPLRALIAVNLVAGALVPGIDSVAHVGGLIGGLILGGLYRSRLRAAWEVGLLGLGIGMIAMPWVG